MVVVSGVFYFAYGTVRLDQGVASMYSTTVAALMLGLVVTGVGIGNGIRVVVFRVRLRIFNYIIIKFPLSLD